MRFSINLSSRSTHLWGFSEEPRSKLQGIFRRMFHSHEKATWGLLPPNPRLPFSRASLRSALVEFALRLPGLDANKGRKLQ